MLLMSEVIPAVNSVSNAQSGAAAAKSQGIASGCCVGEPQSDSLPRVTPTVARRLTRVTFQNLLRRAAAWVRCGRSNSAELCRAAGGGG